MRVHELAKELEKTSKEIIELANSKLGLALKSHSSTITESQRMILAMTPFQREILLRAFRMHLV